MKLAERQCTSVKIKYNVNSPLESKSLIGRSRKLSVAPMMDYTDRYFRYFLRLISRHTLLYTEMVTTGALIHGDRHRFLRFDPAECPLALQLGGSEPAELARCARMGQAWGYDEIDLNLGCPSDRVQSGRFGACLMAEPALVADCIAAMRAAVSIPVTVKHRIGIDHRDSYAELCDFVGTLTQAGCKVFIVHARKGWLQGLSPKENREVPSLRYAVVKQLKRDFPHLDIVINGGIANLDQTLQLLQDLDGVMIGRETYRNPWVLSQADRRVFGDPHPVPDRHEVLEGYLPFVQARLDEGVPLGHVSRHILGLFQGQPGARAWRRYIAERAHVSGAGVEVLRAAAARVGRTDH
jgi:tRNA-dihydrouridine synthase A